MSLILWLPLQGTLENKGISDIVVDGHSSTVDTTNGKLALSCQKFTSAAAQYLSFPAFLNADNDFTYCCWFKTNSIASNQCLYSQRTGADTTGFSIFYMGKTTGTKADALRFDDGESYYSTKKISTTNKWYHLAFVRDATHKYIYIDGVLVGTSARGNATTISTSYAMIGGSQSSDSAAPDGNMLNGYLQDIRIYDHALSAAEVKKISQGLALHYRLNDSDDTTVIDETGYGHDGTIYNGLTFTSEAARYDKALTCDGTKKYINAGRGGMVRDAITVSIWGSMDTWPTEPGRMVSCTQGGGWNFESSSGKIQFAVGTGASSNTYKSVTGTVEYASLASGWHLFTGTYDGYVSKVYLDGELIGTNATPQETHTPLFYNANNTIIIGAEAQSGANNPTSPYFNGKLSDFRIYATALSAEDIKELYQTAMKIDDFGNTHAYEAVEDTGNKILKNGQLYVSSIVENDYMQYLKYDHNIYFEPDGSAWVHIYHHNAPYNNGVFTHTDGTKVSMDEFDEGIYLDEHRWLNMELCNYVNTWEILTVRRYSSANDFTVNRWVQPANPTIAAYEDVTNAKLTKRTTGYVTDKNETGVYSNYSYAGYYRNTLSGQQSYIIASNKSTTWYGAVGARQYWSTTRKDTTGFNSTSTNNGISTGSVDLYLRIDNITFTTPTKTKVTEYGTWSTHEIIEC